MAEDFPLSLSIRWVMVTDGDFVNVDIQMRTNVPHIFAIGDIIPSVAYTDPEVAWVGHQAKAQGIKVKKGLFPWTASGRAIANGRDEGFTKLLFDDSPEAHGHGKILGGGMVGTHAGDMIGEIALAIEMGADAEDYPPAPHAGRKHRHGSGSGARLLHRLAAKQKVSYWFSPWVEPQNPVRS